GKIKPHSMVGSDIKIEAMHELLLFSYTTASLSPQKIAVIYPAEAMNTVSANAFLKSLEEPSGYTRFILCTQQRSRLLSTIISRCCQYPLQLPEVAESKSWLMTQGMAEADAEVMLRATGMRPHESLSYTQKLKIRTEQWESLPKDLQAGKIEWLLQLPKTYIVQILCKVCHDTWVYQQGGRPRFFLPSELPRFIDPKKLLKWYKILLKLAHEVPLDHELWMLNVRLQAQQALN
ncbi:MAG: hypothetical protein QM520_05215, partial [Gammaproteobacteria bacterium]|nr:hypothetical protein [Gammaproteobacteria bacterium]